MKVKGRLLRSNGQQILEELAQPEPVERHGYEFVRLRVNRDQRQVRALVFVSAGGPVLRCTPVEVHLSTEAMHEQPFDLGGMTRAVAAAVLSDAVDRPIWREGFSPEDEVSAVAETWSAFLQRGSGAPSTAGQELRQSATRYLVLDDQAATAGVRTGLFAEGERAGELILQRQVLTVQRHPPLSGFDSHRQMSIAAEAGLAVPAGYQQIDIAAATEALKAAARPSATAVSYYGDDAAPEVQSRRQAAASYPVLAELMATTHSIATAIDERQPLQALLIDRLGLTKGGLKRLSKVSKAVSSEPLFDEAAEIHGADALGVERQRRFHTSGELRLEPALRTLAALQPEWMPDCNEAWLRFNDVYRGCAAPLGRALAMPAEDLLTASKGRWMEFHSGLARAADVPAEAFDGRTIALSTLDALQMVDDLARTVILPTALQSIREAGFSPANPGSSDLTAAFQAAASVVIGTSKNTAGSLLAAARRWSSRIPTLAGLVGSDDQPDARFHGYGESSWPSLIPERFVGTDGRVITCLSTQEALVLESERLGHCVGQVYVRLAQRGDTHIFSVQSPCGGTSFSTVELSPPRAGDPSEAAQSVRVVQHRARRNTEPSAEDQAVVADWIAAIRAGRLQLNLQEVEAWRAWQTEARSARASRAGHWTAILGFDPADHAIRAALWREWRDILGGSFAKAESPGVIYRLDAAREVVRSLNGEAAERLTGRSAEAPQMTEAPAF